MTIAGGPRPSSRLLRRAGPVALALVLATQLAACSGGDADSGGDSDADSGAAASATAAAQQEPTSSGGTDPCGFLTTAEVAAVGIEATDPQPVETATGGLACNYGDDPLEGVQVSVQPGGGQAYFDQSRDLLPAPEPLTGLGDEAVQDASVPQQSTVLVLVDDTVLAVGGSIDPADARSLAEKALGRLGG